MINIYFKNIQQQIYTSKFLTKNNIIYITNTQSTLLKEIIFKLKYTRNLSKMYSPRGNVMYLYCTYI